VSSTLRLRVPHRGSGPRADTGAGVIRPFDARARAHALLGWRAATLALAMLLAALLLSLAARADPAAGAQALTVTSAVTPVEGGTVAAGVVARAHNPEGAGLASEYTATIEWEEGAAPQAATVTVSGEEIDVVAPAPHAYAEEGLKLTVSIEDTSSHAAGSTAVTVADAPLAISINGGVGIGVTAGQPFTLMLGTFEDADPNALASDYTATVQWG